jgi:subtilase family serine protease
MKTTRPAHVPGALRSSSAVGAASLLLALCLALPAVGQEQPLLTRHVRDAVAGGQAVPVERLPPTRTLRLNIALPLRDEPALDALLQALHDPASGLYHQYLTVQEFTARFGPSQQDYDAVVQYATAHGLKVVGTSANRLLVDVTGSVADVERAFHVNLGVYQHPTENRTFYAPDREPAADLPFPLWHVTGLDTFSIPHLAGRRRQAGVVSDASALTGSGPGGDYLGSDMRAAYYCGTALTGAGQSAGVFAFAGYNQSDITAYFAQAGQPLDVPVAGVSTDGSSLTCTGSCDDTDQALEAEEIISMAPALNKVLIYVSDTSDVSIFNRMATDNIAKQLECSWGWSPADPSSDDPIFKEFSAQGQNLAVASGDSGAYKAKSADVYPADDAFVTSVGGTVLVTTGPGGAWKSETAWSDGGGGISPNKIAIPSYQTTTGVITTGNKGSKTYRNGPDLAMNAVNYYICNDGSCSGGWDGTRFSASLWTGYMALVNQQAVADGMPTLGFLNPTLYTIGLGPNGKKDFHDITSGSNGTYSATTGYDLATGWGSPNCANLINALVP